MSEFLKIAGREIALRCLRRRAQRQATESNVVVWTFCKFVAPQPGADGAARRPYQFYA
jgi:hypothetical protein